MQATKNGLKSTLRTPGKTLLFLLILTVTAALLCVSCSVYGAVRGYLADCDDYFHTIAELEYIGESYPNQAVYDQGFAAAVEENRDKLSALIQAEPVLAWEPASNELLISPEFSRWDTFVPDPYAAVLRVRLYAFEEKNGLYTALVKESYYSRTDHTGRLIMIRGVDGAPPLQFNTDYLMVGRFFTFSSGFSSLQIEPASFWENGEIVELPPLLPEGASPEEEAPFLRYAEILHLQNDACRVSYTAAIEDLYPFHQQLMTLTEGRFFTQAEYDSAAKVCIVSERIAGMLGLQVGDRFSFTLYRAEGDLYGPDNRSQIDEDSYLIVGLVSHSDSYPYWVFLPDAQVGRELRTVNGYTLGQFRLQNNRVPDFLELAAPLLEHGFRLNVYDQGYAAATEPMEELLFISGIFLAVCLLLAGCALAMQSHIFISRQREAARTMYAMGSGRLHVCVYYLSGALALTVPAAIFGAGIGKLAEGSVYQVLQRFASQYAEQDLRFSATRLAITRTLDFNPVSAMGSYLRAAAILAGGTLIFTLVFALLSLRDRKTKKVSVQSSLSCVGRPDPWPPEARQKQGARRPVVRQPYDATEQIHKKKKTVRQRAPKRAARVSRLSGFFKYGLLSLLRGRGRTVSVLLLGLAAAMFFGRLTDSRNEYQTQLDAYRQNAVITGSATDYYAKGISGLNVKGRPVSLLCSSDLLEEYSATTKLGNIKFLGVEGKEQLPFNWPQYGAYSYETVFHLLSKEPAWAGTSSVSGSPPFHFSEGGSVEWLEGWSEADFIRLDEMDYQFYDYSWAAWRTGSYRSGPAVCALPKSMMEERGIELGDRINTAIAYYHPYWNEIVEPLQLLVVASYVAPTESSTVYSPVTYVREGLEDENYFPIFDGSEEYWVGRESYSAEELAAFQAMGLSPAMSYSSFTFTLRDSKRLDELRAAMDEMGFTWVHSGERVKPFAKIEDDVYLDTVHSMERQIQYVSVLYTALYLLAGVIGFALAWLLIQSRRQEIAVMRALGTQPGRIIGCFLLEQLLLMTAGLGLGLLLCRLTGILLNPTQLKLTAAFLSVWIVSALICLNLGLRKQSFAALTEPE